MSNDPTAKPDRVPNLAPVASAPSPAPVAAPAHRGLTRQEQVSLWQSFFLGMTRPGELPIYHHSNLFYWWPVWAFGFLFAALTYFGNTHMAVVPEGTVAAPGRKVEIDDKGTMDVRDVLILTDKEKLVTRKNTHGDDEIFEPRIYMSRHKGMGTLFIMILLLVIVITNITLRGLWSIFVLVVLVSIAAILFAAGKWEMILARLGQLAIYVNLGGYFTLSAVLFVLWCVNFFIMDRQTYMIFTPGQVRMRLEIGGGETVYDTAGMVFFKERSDMFRHWVLGFGSGDLVVRPAGLGHALELPNVLRVGKRVKQIEELLKEKVVVTGQGSPGPPAQT